MTFLLLTVRFLDDRYHGLLGRGGPPEWPPSPFRLFCALVAGVARRGKLDSDVGSALAWLQALTPPIIIAPPAKTGQRIIRYVPWNSGDAKPDRQLRLSEKPTIPTLMLLESGQNPEVYYLWDIRGLRNVPTDSICDAARSLTVLGWGVDMAFADAMLVNEEEVRRLSGIRWYPSRSAGHEAGIQLRVPTADYKLQECTLSDLRHCHETAMKRLSLGEPLHTVDEPRVFERVFYTAEPPPHPVAAFEIHRTIEDQEKEDNAGQSKFRPFHHVRRVTTVAGMLRDSVARVASRLGWTQAEIAARIQGHGDGHNGQSTSSDRIQFLPLPSITPNGVGGIRRVLVVGPPGFDITPLRRPLNGEELIDRESQQPVAMLSGIAGTDRYLLPFLRPARMWSSVTPVILPGHDEADPQTIERRLRGLKSQEERQERSRKLYAKAEGLFRKAMQQARFPAPLCDGAVIEWRAVGFRAGLDPAIRYCVSAHHAHYPRYHVRITWPVPVRGPVCLGVGRYYGMGLFATEESP